MKTRNFETIDGNETVARVAYQLNEVIALFPHHAGVSQG
jgi:pyruvate-ferredoxin/flavodoxin oxidoreductase